MLPAYRVHERVNLMMKLMCLNQVAHTVGTAFVCHLNIQGVAGT